jgi:hypothetical protein
MHDVGFPGLNLCVRRQRVQKSEEKKTNNDERIRNKQTFHKSAHTKSREENKKHTTKSGKEMENFFLVVKIPICRST